MTEEDAITYPPDIKGDYVHFSVKNKNHIKLMNKNNIFDFGYDKDFTIK